MSTFATQEDINRLRTELRAELRRELRAERDSISFDIKFSILITLFYVLMGGGGLVLFLYTLLHLR